MFTRRQTRFLKSTSKYKTLFWQPWWQGTYATRESKLKSLQVQII